VVEGFQNGRTLGYPTANLQVDANKLVPENGAYLVRTPLAYGMLNIGTRPTLHNGPRRSIEVHLFDFDGNLYGHTLRVELLEHLRKECEFASLDELRQQLAKDEADCRKRIGQ
jgi:riboflavin kinase/FMN adenylyltransferase